MCGLNLQPQGQEPFKAHRKGHISLFKYIYTITQALLSSCLLVWETFYLFGDTLKYLYTLIMR